MKVGIAYDGWKKTGKDRYILPEKVVTAGFAKAKAFHAYREAAIAENYNLNEVAQRILNADEASWIRKVKDKSTCFQLDPFHWNKAVKNIHNEKTVHDIMELLEEKLDELFDSLETYRNSLWEEKEIEDAEKLIRYYENNRDGLLRYQSQGLELPEHPEGLEYRNMGTMENHVWSVIARRMKHNHTSWSKCGGNHLAKILAKKCSGKLYEMMKSNYFIDIDENDFCFLIPVISPYIIWNNDIIIYPVGNQKYEKERINNDEYKLLNSIYNKLNFKDLSLLYSKSQLMSFISKMTVYNKQCIKIINIDMLPFMDDYFVYPSNMRIQHSEPQIVDNSKYYKEIKSKNEKIQFDEIETTLSYMLRNRNTILNNETYGERFIKSIIEYMDKSFNIDILEVGGGLADFADSVISFMNSENINCSYTICDISENLLNYQRQRLKAKYNNKLYFYNDSAENLNIKDKLYDVIISNEVIADLRSINIKLPITSDCCKLINKYNIHNVKGNYINIGAIKFIEKIYPLLKKNGIAVITEYTDYENASYISNLMSDHKEVSINFSILKDVAEHIGFETEILNLRDFLKIQEQDILSGESFYALRTIYDLEKHFYSKLDMNIINKDIFHNIRFMPIDEMFGFFMALVLKKM